MTVHFSETNEDLSPFFDPIFEAQYVQHFQADKPKKQKKQLQFVMKDDADQILAAASCQQLYQMLKIEDLAVDPALQHQKLGSQLLDYIKDYASSHNLLTLILTTRSYQAKDFYLKQGFSIYGQLADVPFEGVTTYYFVYKV
ncbi:GNAT family N-acetyltransferase [Streptococcus macacae]|uniref:Acetyltransferase, GNAT family n=1 Tax=Streptococcus macacae NCTC 11558 TaxID=764298 RepID=G5JYZ5_9STRE|nr:GNAT family N-acetyltransferase [Streptococcus macacae]EHJ53382.1 acetyltransferase, GNAT family [Streptococcus macacae NCTC 11558]SUN78251.1 histone acetyltransferase HPA2 [Streptococcus macacae NCTC 11558]